MLGLLATVSKLEHEAIVLETKGDIITWDF